MYLCLLDLDAIGVSTRCGGEWEVRRLDMGAYVYWIWMCLGYLLDVGENTKSGNWIWILDAIWVSTGCGGEWEVRRLDMRAYIYWIWVIIGVSTGCGGINWIWGHIFTGYGCKLRYSLNWMWGRVRGLESVYGGIHLQELDLNWGFF